MAEEVKLFSFWGSPYSHRVEVALKLKGVRYEYFEEKMSNKSPLLFQYHSVHKNVPVLLHNGKPIADSAIILENIDETWKTNPILPDDTYAKAMARFWARFIGEKCVPAMWKSCETTGEEQEIAKEEGSQFLKFLEDELADKKFFGGDTIGLVDISANFIALWFTAFQGEIGLELLTKEKFPRLWEGAELCVNCRIFKECLPPNAKEKINTCVRPFLSEISPQFS